MRRNSNGPSQQGGHAARYPVPAGAPSWITPELIEDTLRVWQPHYQETLTPEDAVSMLLNVGELFDVLREEKKP